MKHCQDGVEIVSCMEKVQVDSHARPDLLVAGVEDRGTHVVGISSEQY